MKIYTRVGDRGETGLFGGPKVSKADLRIDAYGSIDELNAAVGVVRAASPPENIDAVLRRVQNQLFTVGAQLATPNDSRNQVPAVEAADITALESDIDSFEATLAPLKTFILPGGTSAAALLHFARTICRRAERSIVRFAKTTDEPGENVRPELLAYVNRLSDLLFVMARSANQQSGTDDVAWDQSV